MQQGSPRSNATWTIPLRSKRNWYQRSVKRSRACQEVRCCKCSRRGLTNGCDWDESCKRQSVSSLEAPKVRAMPLQLAT